MLRRALRLSTARPVENITTNLFTRFISRSHNFGQCLSKENGDAPPADAQVPDPSILPEHARLGDEGYTSTEHRRELNNNDNLNLSCHVQQIISSPSSVEYIDDSEVPPLPHPLDECTEDVSDIGPHLTPTFTFAKYANKSRTVQELVKLGVGLYKYESKQEMVPYILGLDFEKDIQPYIRFLCDCGVSAEYLGQFLTKNLYILKEDMDNLHTRIRYLRAHDFNIDMISTIITKHPKWLLYTTEDIDGRLGYFQHNFNLVGSQIRTLALKGPKMVTFRMVHIMENTFTIKEEMGFDKKQVKALLLKLPRLWMKNRTRLLDVFEYAHHEMQLQHDFLVKCPEIFTCRKSRLEQRHKFLVEMKKAQYDPTKPMYVSPRALISSTDVDFCIDIAQTSVEVYNEFLKTF